MEDETRVDYQKLMTPLLDFAQQQIHEHGAFRGLAAKLSTDGEIALVDAPLASSMSDWIAYLRQIFIQDAQADAIKACAIAYDGYVSMKPDGSDRTDAIIVELEHRGDEPADVSIPYRKARLRGYQFGELKMTHGKGHVFGPPDAS